MALGIVSQASFATVYMTYVTVPTLSTNSFVYDPSTTINITDYLQDYDPSTIHIDGDLTAKNAGEYTITFDLKGVLTHQWDDGNSDTVRSITWNITKKPVSVPTVTDTTKTYNTSSQSPTIAAYDTKVISVSGNKGTNAGSYTVSFTLKNSANYQFDSTDTTVEWTIEKAPGSVTINPSAITIFNSSTTTNVAITRDGNGTISATSSDTNIATCSISNTTLKVLGVDKGTTTIVIDIAESTNYLATSTEVSVTCVLPSKVLNENSWEVISQAAQAGVGDSLWDIGDCKEITLNGTIGNSDVGSLTLTNRTLCIFILDFNHAMGGTAENNIIFGGFKTALSKGKDVVLCEFRMNINNILGGDNSGGWKNSDLRYLVLGNSSSKDADATQEDIDTPNPNTLMATLPSDFRSVLRLWTRWIDGGGSKYNGRNNIRISSDAITILAECEIFAAGTYSSYYEPNFTKRMSYYTAGNSTIRYNANDYNSAVKWWEASPLCSSSNTTGTSYKYNWMSIYSDGSRSNTGSYYPHGIAPAWKI